jgi:YggT family protein
MNGYFSEAGAFLISVAFGFYILLMMLRFLLQTVRADFYNPLSQFIVKLTSPILKPVRRIIPGLGGIDVATLVVLLVLQIIELVLIGAMMGGSLHPAVLLVMAIGRLINMVLYIFIIAIIVQAILSWVQPATYNPMTVILYQLTEPVLRPIRSILPVFSGIDLSPLVAIIALNLVLMAVPHLQTTLLRLFLG